MSNVVGRFAPSPSGRMHLGNIFTAVISYISAKSQGGKWLLRHEDLDIERCNKEYALQIEDDLHFLGLQWDEEPVYQSERSEIYEQYYNILKENCHIYPCFCSRKELHQSAPHGDIFVYSGHCKTLNQEQINELSKTKTPAYRIEVTDKISTYIDRNYGTQSINLKKDCGDFILRRGDKFAYNLAVVVDDILSGVNEIVRGADLLFSTHQQIYLYECFNEKPPVYAHVPIILDDNGNRLSKTNKSTNMGYLRSNHTAEEILGKIAFMSNLIEKEEKISLKDLIELFRYK